MRPVIDAKTVFPDLLGAGLPPRLDGDRLGEGDLLGERGDLVDVRPLGEGERLGKLPLR